MIRLSSNFERSQVACEWHFFPPEALALASDDAGNQLVFLPSAGNTAFGSAVYHWDHETGSLTKVADELGLESLDAG